MDLNSRLILRPRDQSNYCLPLTSPGLTMASTHPWCLLSRRPEMKLGLLCTVQKHMVAGAWGSLSYCKYRQGAWRIECWISGCFFLLKSGISSPQKSTLCTPNLKPFWKFPYRHTEGCVFMEILNPARTAMMSDFHRLQEQGTGEVKPKWYF